MNIKYRQRYVNTPENVVYTKYKTHCESVDNVMRIIMAKTSNEFSVERYNKKQKNCTLFTLQIHFPRP